MRFHEFDSVVLQVDMPSHGLKSGDVGAVVQVYLKDAVEVEFVTASGRTQALVALAISSIRPVSPKDILAVANSTPPDSVTPARGTLGQV